MLRTLVVLQLAWLRVRNARHGLTAIEYGVFAAFIVLALVGVAVVAGPKLSKWITGTIDCIIGGKAGAECTRT